MAGKRIDAAAAETLKHASMQRKAAWIAMRKLVAAMARLVLLLDQIVHKIGKISQIVRFCFMVLGFNLTNRH